MSGRKIISFISKMGNVEGEVLYALFQMIDGRAVMTPCDRDGTPLEEKAA